MIIRVGFQLKRIVPVCYVMAMPFGSSHQVKDGVKHPVKNEQHLNLLPEVNLFVADKLRLITGLSGDPNEDEER